jgi:hypothetical protein
MPQPPNRKPQAKVAPDDPEQSARFIEAGRELGADGPEAEEAFVRAFDRIAPARSSGAPLPSEPVPARVRAKKSKRRPKSPS